MKELLEAIDSETEEKIKQIRNEAEEFAAKKKTEMKEQAISDNNELFGIEEKNISRNMRKREERLRESSILELMKLRDQIINDVWKDVQEKFLSMPKRETEYKEFIQNVFSLVRNPENYEVYMRKGDIGFKKGAKIIDISGGAIFRTFDGKIEINYSLEGILADSEEATKAVIAEVLFG